MSSFGATTTNYRETLREPTASEWRERGLAAPPTNWRATDLAIRAEAILDGEPEARD